MDMVIPLNSFLLICFLFFVYLKIIFYKNKFISFICNGIIFLFSSYFFFSGDSYINYIWLINIFIYGFNLYYNFNYIKNLFK
jgi:hypothetical protein